MQIQHCTVVVVWCGRNSANNKSVKQIPPPVEKHVKRYS